MLDKPKLPGEIARHWIGGAGGTASMLVGGLVLAGWMPDLPMPSLFGQVSLKAVTALCFVLSGAAMFLLQVRSRHCVLAARICTVILGVISVMTLAEDATGWRSGISKVLASGIGPVLDNFERGRMGPTTALSFTLTAAALWLMGRAGGSASRPLVLGWLGTLVVATGLFSGMGNVAGLAGGDGWWNPANTETYTTPLFVLLGGGLLAVAWKASGERWLIERWITTGFAVGLALLVAISWFSHQSTRNLINAAERVKHSHEVLAEISELRSSLEELESGMRGYVITGNEGFFPLSEKQIANTRTFLRKLRALTADHQIQQQRIDQLESRFDEGLQISRELIELRRTTGFSAAAAQVAGGRGRTMMDSIRRSLLEMETEERLLLQGREEESAAITDRTFALLPIGTVLSFVLLASVLLRLNREMAARQQGADSLRRSERRLRLALDAAQIGEWELNLDTHAIRRSLRHDQIFGYSGLLPEWTYELFLEHVHPEDRDRVDASFQASVAAGRDWEFDCRIIREDGSDGWIWARGTVIRDDDSDRLVEMLGMVRDITGQKHTEAELRLATARFQLALKNSAISVFNQDLDLRHTWVYNPPAGLELAEIIGKRESEILERKEDAAILEAIKRDVIATGVGRHEEVAIRSHGEDRCYDILVDPLPDAAGRTTGVISVAVNVTARKKVDEAQRVSEAGERARREELEALMDVMPVAVFIAHDAACRVMTSNRAAEKLLRIPRGGQPSASVTDGERPDFHFRAGGRLITAEELPMQRAAATGQALTGEEIEIVFPDGGKRDLLGSAVPLFNESGVVRGCVGVFVDITSRKQGELNVAFLAEMQSMTGQFSSPVDTLRLRGKRIVEHLHLDRCLFMEISDSAGEFTVLHDHHAPDLHDHTGVCRLADFHTDEEFRRMAAGGMLVMDDTRQSPFAERFAAQGIGALANAIHVVDGSWKFLLSAQRRQAHKWSPEDISLLGELAQLIYLRLERARAEERLRESEARFRSIFHEAAVPMEVSMPNGRFAQVNRAFCELLGYSEEELLSITFGQITHPDDLDHLTHEPLLGLIHGDITCFRAEKRYLRKDGEVVWVDLSVSVVRDAANKPLYFIGQIQDITGRKRAEEALGKIETMLAMAIEGAQFGIWDWDILTNKLFWSEQRKAMSGLPADAEITYEIGTSTVHPDDRERLEETIIHAQEMKADGQQEFRTVWPDGTVRWLHGRGRIFKDQAGSPIRYTGITIDVTEQREADEALRKSEELLVLATEAGQLGIWNWDQGAHTLVWSDRCNAMTGQSHKAGISQFNAMEAIHPDDRARVHAEAMRALDSNVDLDLEFRTLWPDGTVRWLQARGRGFENEAGELVRITGIMHDVTDRREAEEALRGFNAELESLVRERTEVIQMTMQELREEIAARRRLEEEILSIGEREQARIGQDLHDDLGQQLVGLSILIQLLSGKLGFESHPAAADAARMKSLVSECLATTRNLAKSLYPVELERGGLLLSLQDLAQRTELTAGIVCTVSTDDEFRFEKSAEIHLYRIVQESIANALKHGKAHHIAITCAARGGVSTLTVTDDGSGFEAQAGSKREGMGLHLFDYRARLIGATIEVSRGKSGGCRVRCLLPDQAP